MKNRGKLKAFAFAAALAAVACVAPTAGAEPLRVCADPDNLPFTKADGPEHGLYLELAELVAKQLNQSIEYTWWDTHFQRRALRNTILQGSCDAVFALPADADYKVRGLQRTQAFLQVSYAVVAAHGYRFKSLDDLKTQRLGVQFSSTPHILLSQYEGFRSTTYRSVEELFAALAKGDIDAAFMWGPVAGYENKKRWASRWQVTPVSGHDLSGSVAVAVRRGKDELAAGIDKALTDLKPQIAELADKYGFPRDRPVSLAGASFVPRSVVAVSTTLVSAIDETGPVKPPKAAKPRAKAASAPGSALPATAAVTAAAPVAAMPPEALAGKVMFNDKCSHCHGTDGFSPVRERDVRYLKTRYSEKWVDTATVTIKNGRPDAGMPVWKEILQEPELQQILSFLTQIQK